MFSDDFAASNFDDISKHLGASPEDSLQNTKKPSPAEQLMKGFNPVAARALLQKCGWSLAEIDDIMSDEVIAEELLSLVTEVR